MEGERLFSVFRLIFGLFLGLVVGLGCFLLSLTIIPIVGRNDFLIPMLNAAMLAGAAFLAFRHDTQDRSLVIGIGFYCREAIAEQRIFARYVDCPRIGLIVCTMCGVAMGPGPFVLRP